MDINKKIWLFGYGLITMLLVLSVVSGIVDEGKNDLNQESNVLEIAKGNSKEDDSKVGKWILIIFGIAVFSAAGFLSLKIKSN